MFNNELMLMHASFVLHKFLEQTSNIDHSSDGNGIMFTPMFKADVDSECASPTLTKRYASIIECHQTGHSWRLRSTSIKILPPWILYNCFQHDLLYGTTIFQDI